MVRALEQEQESYRSRLFHFKGMFDNGDGRNANSMILDNSSSNEEGSMDGKLMFRSQGARTSNDQVEKLQIGSVHSRNDQAPRSRFSKDEASNGHLCKDKQNAGKSNSNV